MIRSFPRSFHSSCAECFCPKGFRYVRMMEDGALGTGEYPHCSFCYTIRRRVVRDSGCSLVHRARRCRRYTHSLICADPIGGVTELLRRLHSNIPVFSYGLGCHFTRSISSLWSMWKGTRSMQSLQTLQTYTYVYKHEQEQVLGLWLRESKRKNWKNWTRFKCGRMVGL